MKNFNQGAEYFKRKDQINFGRTMPVDQYGMYVRANKRH